MITLVQLIAQFHWKKNAETKKDSSENFLNSSRRRPEICGGDDRNVFICKIFTDFSNTNISERHNRYKSKGTAFAECFDRTVIELFRKTLSDQRIAN